VERIAVAPTAKPGAGAISKYCSIMLLYCGLRGVNPQLGEARDATRQKAQFG